MHVHLYIAHDYNIHSVVLWFLQWCLLYIGVSTFAQITARQDELYHPCIIPNFVFKDLEWTYSTQALYWELFWMLSLCRSPIIKRSSVIFIIFHRKFVIWKTNTQGDLLFFVLQVTLYYLMSVFGTLHLSSSTPFCQKSHIAHFHHFCFNQLILWPTKRERVLPMPLNLVRHTVFC